MISVFVTDIDGCLATPYQPFRLDVLSEIRKQAREAGKPGSHPILPAISICSGRAYPYVEAVSQLLDLSMPVLFESGAGVFDPVRMQCYWHPELEDGVVQRMEDVKRFVSILTSGTSISVDLSKRSQVAIVAPEKTSIDAVYEEIRTFVTASHPEFRTFITPFSIDVVAPNLTKREGLLWLAELCDVSVDSMAFIGDTDGDIGALLIAGRSFAPANADTTVKEIVDVTTAGENVFGVLEAYRNVVKMNEDANRLAT